jgi:DNA-binding CsgD family transcriptional regulator
VEGPAPLVGRRDEIAAITAAVAALSSGRSGAIALRGEPGIGKTRLLEELRRRSDAQGMAFLSGRASELERELPFAVCIDALADRAAEIGADRLQRLVGDQAAELAPVAPGVDGLGAAAGLQDERYRTHRAVRALLEALGSRQKLVLALDDLHWADDASLELVAHVLRRPPRRGVLIALAYRPAPARPVLATAVAAATRDAGLAELTVAPLTRSESDALLGDLPGPARDAIFAEGGGNPFYLQELARAPVRDGPPDAAADGDIPHGVAAALAQETAALPPAALELARAAAATGDPVDLDLAARAARLDDDEALAALDALLAAALLHPAGAARQYRFRHPLVRRAVYDGATEGWRLAAHERIAAALAERGAPAAARAHHLERCARPGDVAAAGVLLEAGGQAGPRAPATAARWYGAALRLLPDAPETAMQRLAVLAARAQALAATGELEDALDALGEALARLPAELGAMRPRLVASCAMCENLLGRHEAAHARLLEALAAETDERSAVAAELQVELAADALFHSDFAAMAEWATLGRATAVAQDQAGLAVVADAVLCFAENGAGRSAEASRAAAAAAERLDGLGDDALALRLDAPYYLGFAEYFAERYEAAIRHFRRGIALSRAAGQGQFVTPMSIGLAHAYEVRGRIADAIETAEGAVEAARLSGNAQVLCWALTAEAWIGAIAGQLDRTHRAGEEAVGLLTGLDESLLSRATRVHVAAAYLEAGEAQRCLDAMAGAGAPEFAHVEPGRRAWLYAALARAELALGHHPAARDWIARGEDVADGLGLDHAEATVRYARGLVELAAGEPRAARAAAERAATLAEEAGAVIQAARARALEGRAAAAAGDPAAAVARLERAQAELGAYGADRLRDEAARELRRLGRRVTVRRRPSGGDAGLERLSGREREIAGLVASGHTNREIAGALYLSEKTIENHLTKVFAKLGVSGRAALAEAVGRSAGDDR